MRKLGDKTMTKIQNLIATSSPKKTKSPNRIKPSTARQAMTQSSPEPIRRSVSPINKNSRSIYIPMQKEAKLLQRQTQILYQEMEKQSNFTLQNPHSFFLNQRHPRKPIYERAQEIIRQRQTMLQEKRLQQNKLIQEKQTREYQQYLKNLPPKKIISKQKAQMITQKLYKEHFAKTNRLNNQKMEQFREDSKYFRNRPLINETTKEIYHKMAEKNQLSNDIINRFQQYAVNKQETKKEMEKQYKERYYPFKPAISDNSKNINSTRKQSEDLSKSHNCRSCNFIKPFDNRKNLIKQSSMQLTSKFTQQFQ